MKVVSSKKENHLARNEYTCGPELQNTGIVGSIIAIESSLTEKNRKANMQSMNILS